MNKPPTFESATALYAHYGIAPFEPHHPIVSLSWHDGDRTRILNWTGEEGDIASIVELDYMANAAVTLLNGKVVISESNCSYDPTESIDCGEQRQQDHPIFAFIVLQSTQAKDDLVRHKLRLLQKSDDEISELTQGLVSVEDFRRKTLERMRWIVDMHDLKNNTALFHARTGKYKLSEFLSSVEVRIDALRLKKGDSSLDATACHLKEAMRPSKHRQYSTCLQTILGQLNVVKTRSLEAQKAATIHKSTRINLEKEFNRHSDEVTRLMEELGKLITETTLFVFLARN